MSMLRITGVEKTFSGVPVLRGVSLEVPAGEITAILGPSGCGKTTLLRLVAGFLRPDGGSIEIGGQLVSTPSRQVPPERRRLGYLAQEGALFPHLTVAKNIAFGLPRRDRRDPGPLRELLDLVSLDSELVDRYPHELSGGQQQRVALARTLAPRPRLVLLDEPFSALDASLRADTRALVATALAATGVTTLLVTHDQQEALSFADRIAIMRSGTLAQVGDPRRVYDDPVDLPTAEFIGDTCLLRAVVRGDTAHSALGEIPIRCPAGVARFDGPATLMLRPEQLQIRPLPSAVGGPAVVTSVEYFGHDCIVTAEIVTTEIVTTEIVTTEIVTAELPADPHSPATTLTCRLLAGEQLTPGDFVAISVNGPALAYPVTTPDGLPGTEAARVTGG